VSRDYRPFSVTVQCDKCCSFDVACLYRPDAHAYGCRAHAETNCCTDEHFDRICRFCGYTWREEVQS